VSPTSPTGGYPRSERDRLRSHDGRPRRGRTIPAGVLRCRPVGRPRVRRPVWGATTVQNDVFRVDSTVK